MIDQLALTPLEIMTAPLFKHLRTKRESLLICPHESPFINPNIDFVRKINTDLKICLIHIGKCAGESIMTYLRCALPPGSFSIVEYHCFQSNKLIQELLTETQLDPRIVIIIPIRDPLDRWEAAFNWDYHHVVLSTPEPVSEYMQMIREFPKVADLARAIAEQDQRACKYGRLHHMGMGAAWYLPAQTVLNLPSGRTYLIRLESIQKDIGEAVRDMASVASIQDVRSDLYVPLTKAHYKEAYPKGTFGSLKSLNSKETERMRQYLCEDYQTLVLLNDFIAGKA